MYIVVTDKKIYKASSLAGINKKIKGKLTDDDFRKIGNDSIVNMNKEDITFVRDLKAMSRIQLSKLYKKNDVSLYLMIGIAILQLISIVK